MNHRLEAEWFIDEIMPTRERRGELVDKLHRLLDRVARAERESVVVDLVTDLWTKRG